MSRYLHVTYCDDVRYEEGNKFSMMGIYGGEMVVSSFPLTLPKLCIVVYCVTPVDRPLRKVQVVVLKDDEVVIDTGDSVPVDFTPMPEHVFVYSSAHLVLSPLLIGKPSKIRVRVTTEEGEMVGASLAIKPLESEELPLAPH